MRHLDNEFMEDLNQGRLRGLLDMVTSDSSLCLELRGSAVHVYYRGGLLMEVKRERDSYSFDFDGNYFKGSKGVDLPEPHDSGAWLEIAPRLKNAIDRHPNSKDEREFQQVLLRENNFSRIAKSTDYYICDIEYAASGHGQFDLIAVHWPTTRRSQVEPRRLVFIEMKYGDNALDGESGIGSHIENACAFLRRTKEIESFKHDMVKVFNQKRRLGLMKCKKDLESFSDDPPLFLLVFANHQPHSSTLAKELRRMHDSRHAEVCIAIANASFMGYGLYDQAIHMLEEAPVRFGDYIHSLR